jgi:hypothetical protein
MKSDKIILKFMILAGLILAIIVGQPSTKVFAQDTTILLFDDFNGSSLNTSVWTFNPDSSGASYIVNNSELQITSGYTHGGGGIIRSMASFYAYPDTLVLEIRAKTSNRNGGNVALIDNNLLGRIAFMNSGCGWPNVSGLQAGVYTINNESLCVDIPNIQTEDYHVYRIEYIGTGARYFVDNVLVLSQLDVLVDMPLHLQMDRVSAGIEEIYTVDYVKIYSLSSSPTETPTPTEPPTPTPTPTLDPYSFTGFFQPVDNLPMLNTVNAGKAIPVKFSLHGDQGLDIFASGYPSSTQVVCGNIVEDAIEQIFTAGSSSLSYNTSSDQYTYVWKTQSSWAGTCRTLIVKLDDGTYHRANFKFK